MGSYTNNSTTGQRLSRASSHESSLSPVTNGDAEVLSQPTDFSESSDSESLEKNRNIGVAQCTAPHDWKHTFEDQFPCSVDQLFTMLFTNSKFDQELHQVKQRRDYTETPWETQSNGDKTRFVTYIQPLNNPVGPKTVSISDTQTLYNCSKPGMLYSVNSSIHNGGVSYGDNFTVETHYCMKAVSSNTCLFRTYVTVKYKKSTWGVVKTFVEKGAYDGMTEYSKLLATRILAETNNGTSTPSVNGKLNKKPVLRQQISSTSSTPPPSPLKSITEETVTAPRMSATQTSITFETSDWPFYAFIILILLNIILGWKLYNCGPSNVPYEEIHIRYGVQNIAQLEEWAKILDHHTLKQHGQLLAWRDALDHTVLHLAQTEKALLKLLETIKPAIDFAQEQATTAQRNEM